CRRRSLRLSNSISASRFPAVAAAALSCTTLSPAECADDPNDEIEFGCYYIWGTVLGNHGVTEGRTCYEVKFADAIDTSAAPFTFSCFRGRLDFGSEILRLVATRRESKNTWSYSSYGAAFCEGRMNSDYGIELQPDDILSLLIDVKSMSDGNAVAEFSVEVVTAEILWASQQIFYKCMASDGDSKLAWFPHLALMNCSLDCNFGASPVALDDRMHAGRLILGKMPARSLQTSEYADPISSALPPKPELHLTVGLPASGKTYYARNLPYTRRRLLLGMDQLIEMTLLPERGITKNMGQEVHTRDRVNYFLYTYGSRIMFMQADEAIAMGCDVPHRSVQQLNGLESFVESGYSVALHVLHPTPSIMNDFQSRLVTEFGLRGSETARLQLQANFTLPSPQSDQGVDIQYVRSSRSQLLNGVKKLITRPPSRLPGAFARRNRRHCNKLGISIANPFVPSQRRLASHAEALFARLASAAEARRLQQQQQQNQKQSLQQATPPTVAMEQPAQAAASAPPVSLGSFSVFDKLGFDTSLLKNVLQSVSVSSASADSPALQQQQSQQQQQQQSQQQQQQQHPAVAGEATSVIERFVEICSVRESKELLLSQLQAACRTAGYLQ
uniref:Peptidylprolyl isomerase n=1 Tax=Macrostomum lignano TaxID=282301 RepID=A0A1I8FQE9_9PLAT